MRAYVGAIDPELKRDRDKAAAADAEILAAALSEEEQARSSSLYYVLVQLAQDKALKKVRPSPEGNGLEAWRLFNAEWELRVRGRFGAVLSEILATEFSDPLVQTIEQWETEIKR